MVLAYIHNTHPRTLNVLKNGQELPPSCPRSHIYNSIISVNLKVLEISISVNTHCHPGTILVHSLCTLYKQVVQWDMVEDTYTLHMLQ